MAHSTRFLVCLTFASLIALNPATAAGAGDASITIAGADEVSKNTAPLAAGSRITTSSTSTTVSNSSSNYYDDGLVWGVDIAGWKNPSLNSTPDLCIPAETRIMGRSTTLTTVSANAPPAGQTPAAQKRYLQVQLNPTRYLFSGPQDPVLPSKEKKFKVHGVFRTCQISPPILNPGKIYHGQIFYVSEDDLQNADYRSGLDYGALVVPFKVQLSGDKSISGTASLGGYLGYNLPWMNEGITFRPIVFAGATTISTSSTSATSTSSQTLAGFSYGFGLISQIKNSSFQVGFVLGFDHVSSSQTYTYNDKPWLSLEIGYSFAQ